MPGRKRKLVDEVRGEWRVSIRRVCAIVEFDKPTYHYRSGRSGLTITTAAHSASVCHCPIRRCFTRPKQYQAADLIQPNGGLVNYTRSINPADPTDNDRTIAHFITNTPGENALLQSIQDRFGNKITFTRSNGISGNITQVSSSNGRFIRFSYDSNNCITQAVDNIGRTVSYTYDSSSRLTTATDPNGGLTTYTRDSANRVVSIIDARGVTVLTNVLRCQRLCDQSDGR